MSKSRILIRFTVNKLSSLNSRILYAHNFVASMVSYLTVHKLLLAKLSLFDVMQQGATFKETKLPVKGNSVLVFAAFKL